MALIISKNRQGQPRAQPRTDAPQVAPHTWSLRWCRGRCCGTNVLCSARQGEFPRAGFRLGLLKDQETPSLTGHGSQQVLSDGASLEGPRTGIRWQRLEAGPESSLHPDGLDPPCGKFPTYRTGIHKMRGQAQMGQVSLQLGVTSLVSHKRRPRPRKSPELSQGGRSGWRQRQGWVPPDVTGHTTPALRVHSSGGFSAFTAVQPPPL